MKKIIFFFLAALSISASGQTTQYGDWYFRGRVGVNKPTNNLHPGAVFEVNDSSLGTLFRLYKDGVLQSWKLRNNAAGDSILSTDQFGKLKLIPKSSLSIQWDSITGKPSNFSTTYALSNDIQDSLLNKVSRNGSYSDPSWITGLAWSKLTGVPSIVTLADSSTILAGRWLPNRSADTAAALQSRIQTKSPLIGSTDITTLGTIGTGVWNGSAIADAYISSAATWNAKQNALGYTAENLANKGVANGYADLDALGKIPASRIDFTQTGQTYVVASQSAMLAISGANVGAIAIRTDENKNYRLIGSPASTLGNWLALLTPDAPVQSVNGFTGNVNLLTTHISEGSNYYWTAARSRAAQSLTTSGSSGAASYDNTTGVLNIPTYTLAGLGGQPALSGTGFVKISGTTISYDNSTYLTSYTETDPTIYSWAKAASKPSYSWGEITGTVPTWNQNTTGTAANATLWNGWGNSFSAGVVGSGSGLSDLAGTAAGGALYRWNASAVKEFLGLGSYAYRSSGLAELSGATFTGGISGTSATFSSTGSFTNQLGVYGTGSTIFTSGAASSVRAGAYTWMGGSGGDYGSVGYNIAYTSTSGSYNYFTTDYSSILRFDAGGFRFLTAPSGTVGTPITYTERAYLGSSQFSINVPLSGTTASFSGGVTATSFVVGNGQYYKATRSSGSLVTDMIGIPSGTDNVRILTTGDLNVVNGSLTNLLTISNTGAATFGSSVTAGGNLTANSGGESITLLSLAPNYATIRDKNSFDRIWFENTGGYRTIFDAPSGGSFAFRDNAGTVAMSLTNAGAITAASSVTATAFYESSDLRQKTVHTTLKSSDGIDAIQYTFKPSNADKWGYGAQQVQPILPYAVSKGEDGFLKVDYTTVHTYKIAQLEKRIAELEKQLKK